MLPTSNSCTTAGLSCHIVSTFAERGRIWPTRLPLVPTRPKHFDNFGRFEHDSCHAQVFWLFVIVCGAACYRLYQNAQQLTLAVSLGTQPGLPEGVASASCCEFRSLDHLSSSGCPESAAAGHNAHNCLNSLYPNADGWRQRAAVLPAVLATWAGHSGSRPHGPHQHHQLAACSHGQVCPNGPLAPITDKAACAQGLVGAWHGQGCED